MKARIMGKLNDLHLRSKVIFSITVFLILPSLLISIVMSNQVRGIMMTNTHRLSRENITRSMERSSEVLERAIAFADRASVDQELADILNRRYADNLDVFLSYDSYDSIRDYLDYNPVLAGIRIYMDNSTLLNNWEFVPIERSTEAKDWYQRAVASEGENLWLSISDEIPRDNAELSLVRKILFPRYGSFAVLIVDIDTEQLGRMLSQESFDTFLVNSDGYIFATGRPDHQGLMYSQIADNMPSLDTPRSWFPVSIEGRSYRLTNDIYSPRNSGNDIHVVSLFSVDTLVDEVDRVWAVSLVVILVVFILAITLIYLVFRAFVQRVIAIKSGMDVVAQGCFHSFLEVDGKDEIGQLGERFNNMVRNMQELMEEIHQSNEERLINEQHQADIKLKMLANQINPHFLFNSLEAIRMKAHIEQQPEIATIVKSLGKLMRQLLDVGGSLQPLSSELEIIESFLSIEQFRLDSKLRYSIDVDGELLEKRLPPLLIQPLVENAVVHGVEKSVTQGNVLIRGRIDNHRMTISVEDNGPGISQELFQELQKNLEIGLKPRDPDSDKRRRIGMLNVQERLILNFGDSAGLCLSQPPQGGLLVMFSIPLEMLDV